MSFLLPYRGLEGLHRFYRNLAFCLLLPWLLLLMAPGSLLAEVDQERVVPLHLVAGEEKASRYVDYINNEDRVFTLEDLIEDQRAPHIKWAQNHSEVPSFGFDSNTYWFRLVVRNESSLIARRLFEIKNPVLDEVWFFQMTSSGQIVKQLQTGDKKSSNARPFFHHNLIIPFSVPSGEKQYIYFRVTTQGSMEFPIALWRPESFQKRDQFNLLLFGGLFGVMVVMAIYNLFIYVLFRDVSMVYYAGFSVCLMLFMASMHGFSAQFFWPEQEWFRQNALLVVIPLTVVFALLFTDSFLQMEKSIPLFHTLIILLVYFNLGLVLLAPFADYSSLIRVSAGLVIPYSISGILVGVLRWWQGYKPARFFVFAWSAFLLALLYYSLAKFGVVPTSLLSDFALQFGAVSEAVLFAFALADRMNTQRKSYLSAQSKAFAAHKAANEELEHSVALRTSELQSAMDKLEKANSRLQTLSMQDGLTGIRNRRYFDEKLEKEWHRCLRNADHLALLLIDIDFFKAFNDKYGHLAGDECLKGAARLIEATLTRPSDSVARYGGEEFAVILPETSMEGAVHVAECIQAAFANSGIDVDGQPVFVTVSIGVASVVPEIALDSQSLIAQADQCLYRAKAAGRNCIKTKADQL